jgi:hypothetical protein
MKKIIGNRNTGKTTELIKMSAEKGFYIVCKNQSEASNIAIKALDLDLQIPFPITYEEFINKDYYPRGIRGFLIDNVEMLLLRLTNVNIEAITMNIDDSN